jgi:hypothetical protein
MGESKRKRGQAAASAGAGASSDTNSQTGNPRIFWKTLRELIDHHIAFLDELMLSGEGLGDVRVVVTQLGVVDPTKVLGINEAPEGVRDKGCAAADAFACRQRDRRLHC